MSNFVSNLYLAVKTGTIEGYRHQLKDKIPDEKMRRGVLYVLTCAGQMIQRAPLAESNKNFLLKEIKAIFFNLGHELRLHKESFRKKPFDGPRKMALLLPSLIMNPLTTTIGHCTGNLFPHYAKKLGEIPKNHQWMVVGGMIATLFVRYNHGGLKILDLATGVVSLLIGMGLQPPPYQSQPPKSGDQKSTSGNHGQGTQLPKSQSDQTITGQPKHTQNQRGDQGSVYPDLTKQKGQQ